ncbi:polyprotein [Elysia marginata]|uniref:Polyprotein n=1 Tax=Elysia marginata TaxID=1093978 RepID=A0AAV4GRS4_9GAST|nr:polyprotein [Elysia marginata]
MLKADIIEPSDSAYSSPIVLVKKPTGEYRFCNDYRRLNAISRDDAEPMPEIDTIMSNLSGSRFFTKLDLTKGYWQVPLEEKTKPLTAFPTPKGLFQYKVLSFGYRVKGKPSNFQPYDAEGFKGYRPRCRGVVDDVLCHASTWKEHIEICKKVLQRLSNANLKLKPSKTLIGMAEVEFLGHVIKEGIMKPQDGKINAIINCERPTTKKQVRSFLGLAGYYRKFMPNYSSIAAPLSDITKTSKGQKFIWEQVQENAFKGIKKMLSSTPVLSMPDWKKEFIVQTDASCAGIGACLLQEHNGIRHVVMYISRKLKPAETRYSTIERECLAIVYALSKLEPYLYGRHFVIESDHAPLTWIRVTQQLNSRVTRWALALQPFDFRVENIKGRDAIWADALSRLPQKDK